MFDFEVQIGTEQWLDAIVEEQIAEYQETPAGVDYAMDTDEHGVPVDFDDDDDDVIEVRRYGEQPEKPPPVFEPLPPGAGIADGIIRGSRAWQALQPPVEVDEFTLRVRALLAADARG